MEKPISTVPVAIRVLLILSLCFQISWSYLNPATAATARPLPDAPDSGLLQLSALGEPETLARLLMLWLQAFDDQSGLGIPFAELDYARIILWLDALLDLDSGFQYPLLYAARVYTETPDNAKKRQMLAFVHRRFLQDPERRWPWLAHAVHVARHRIKDPQLALEYAGALRLNVTGETVPPWVSQLEIFILEDLDELESARILIGALLTSGRFADNENELRFLRNKLVELQVQGRNTNRPDLKSTVDIGTKKTYSSTLIF